MQDRSSQMKLRTLKKYTLFVMEFLWSCIEIKSSSVLKEQPQNLVELDSGGKRRILGQNNTSFDFPI